MSELRDNAPPARPPYTRHCSRLTSQQRRELSTFLLAYLEDETAELRKTHWFDGRYENIYLQRDVHPLLVELIEEALELAAEQLETTADELAVGFWLNLMPPGHSTTLHSHDDMDELLSAVFYLEVPQHSGNLQIQVDGELVNVEPSEGDYLFFSPRLAHAVGQNRSRKPRLSLAMNFGPRTGSWGAQ